MRLLIFSVFLILLCASYRQNISAKTKETVEVIQDSVARISVADSLAFAKADSIHKLFVAGELFYPTVIRVADGKEQFIFDEDIADSVDILLDTASREDYYRTYRNRMDPKLLQAHRLAWTLKEMQMQQSGNGGVGTVMTWLTQTPTDKEPYYKFFIKRMYDDRIGTVIPIPYILVNVKTKQIFVESMNSGEILSIKEWRRNGNEFKEEL